MKNKGIITGIILVALLAIGFWWWEGKESKTQGKEVVKIGVILPLTGELGNFGKTVLNGIELRLEEYKKNNSEKKIVLVIEDSKGNNKDAANAFNKIVLDKKIQFVIGDLTSGGTLTINPISLDKKVLLISPTASSPLLTNSNPYFLRIWQSDNYDGEVAASYCYNDLKLRKMSIVYLNNDYCNGLRDAFKKEFINLGGIIDAELGYEVNQLNWDSEVLKIKKLNSDGIYLPGHPSGIATFLKQSSEQNLKTTMFSNVAAEDKDFFKISGVAANGLYFTTPSFDINSQDEKIISFVTKYQESYQEQPDIHSVKGYEVLDILINGIMQNNVKSEEMVEYIKDKEVFPSLEGNLVFQQSGDVRTGIVIKQYVNDSITIIRNFQ